MRRQVVMIRTSKSKEILDITEEITNQCRTEDKIVSLFVGHTTTALTTADLDPGTDLDMLDAWYGMLPDIHYRHPHNPKHAPDHIIASLIGSDVTIPIDDGKPKLGAWQRIILVELNGPRERHITLTYL